MPCNDKYLQCLCGKFFENYLDDILVMKIKNHRKDCHNPLESYDKTPGVNLTELAQLIKENS